MASKAKAARIVNPCDGCTIRRVRCEDTRPCVECRKRGVPCTSFRTRQKRGPKGPRVGPSLRILEYQRLAASGHDDTTQVAKEDGGGRGDEGDDDGDDDEQGEASIGRADSSSLISEASPLAESIYGSPGRQSSTATPLHDRLAVAAAAEDELKQSRLRRYRTFLAIFRDRLFSLWPLVDCDELLDVISSSSSGAADELHETWALAAAVCAAAIAQLRLPQHAESRRGRVSSEMFAREARQFREQYDYLESTSHSALLTSFFLHMHYANALKLRAAAHYLREAVTYAQTLQLDCPALYRGPESPERSTRLRLYWFLVLTERTFCAQNGIPSVLRMLDAYPPSVKDCGGDLAAMEAFFRLTRLFKFLHLDLNQTSVNEASGSISVGGSGAAMTKERLIEYQEELGCNPNETPCDEIQRVDLFVTRQWIRLLLWEYSVRHFPLASGSEETGFSLLFPAEVARELLVMLASVSVASIRAHGYGMELKVFRVADLLMDVVASVPAAIQKQRMLVDSRDSLASLSKVLLMVGGQKSTFVARTQHRLGELEIQQGPSLPILSTREDMAQDDSGF